MGCHPRIETKDYASFLTTRSRNSELWLINNHPLEQAILGYLAKFRERYGVKLYSFAIQGNHLHGLADFPNLQRGDFMRDLNSCVARAVPVYVPEYPGGSFWARRYSQEFVPGAEDVENQFFYTVLQPVQDGLVERISDYPGYNCFRDAVYGIERQYKVFRRAEYNAAKRHNPAVAVKDYTDVVKLRYERLPGYEHLSQKEYAKLMHEKLEIRRQAIVSERLRQGKGFLGRDRLLRTPRGTRPKNTKTSTIKSFRPRVLSVCPKRRAECTDWYFSIYFAYREIAPRYRAGEDLKLPLGTYPPPRLPQAPPEKAWWNIEF